jgi:hypothetical protein
MSTYDEIRELIESNSDVAEFADFGDGIEVEWIEKAEAVLGCKLPNSYRWWLTNYSGGEIGGEEVFSIYCEDFETVNGGDIVKQFLIRTPKDGRIPLMHSDVDGVFCFDPSLPSSQGEYAIISEATGKQYAKDFLEFLSKRIRAFSPA